MKKRAFSHIDSWYPIFKGEGREYAEQMKNIFLGYGVKGLSGDIHLIVKAAIIL